MVLNLKNFLRSMDLNSHKSLASILTGEVWKLKPIHLKVPEAELSHILVFAWFEWLGQAGML